MDDNERELWQKAEERYTAIEDLISKISMGIRSGGCDEIPECAFCKEYSSSTDCEDEDEDEVGCKECPWGKEFGICNLGGSKWSKLLDKTVDLSVIISALLAQIKCKLQQDE